MHVTSIDVSDRRLTIHADRLTLIYDRHALAFQTSGNKKPGNKKPKRTSRLRIETELDAGAATAEKAQALLAKIFLTPRIASPTSCRIIGSPASGQLLRTWARIDTRPADSDKNWRLSQAFRNPGKTKTLRRKSRAHPLVRIEKEVTPPRGRLAPDPEFSTEARELHYQGRITLWLAVDTDGEPRNIRIAKPLGMGDWKAVECVEKWCFDPAQQDGQPVAVEMAVQVEFHHYECETGNASTSATPQSPAPALPPTPRER